MNRYLVILHAAPGETGDTLQEFTGQLAALLGVKAEKVEKNLKEYPAIIAADASEEVASKLCEAIEALGGVAEVMSEGSGIFPTQPAPKSDKTQAGVSKQQGPAASDSPSKSNLPAETYVEEQPPSHSFAKMVAWKVPPKPDGAAGLKASDGRRGPNISKHGVTSSASINTRTFQ